MNLCTANSSSRMHLALVLLIKISTCKPLCKIFRLVSRGEETTDAEEGMRKHIKRLFGLQQFISLFCFRASSAENI